MAAHSPNLILPSFRHIADLDQARAISEPFVRRDAYTTYPGRDLPKVEPLVVGAAYFDMDRDKFAFGLAGAIQHPYATAQAFMQSYEYHIGGIHRDRVAAQASASKKGVGALYREGAADQARAVKSKTLKAGLQTVAAFAVYKIAGREQLGSALWVPSRVAEEIPLEGREALLNVTQDSPGAWSAYLEVSDSIPGVSNAAAINRAAAQAKTLSGETWTFGILHAARRLPSAKEIQGYLSHEDMIGDFFSLPRKERKALLKRERKQT